MSLPQSQASKLPSGSLFPNVRLRDLDITNYLETMYRVVPSDEEESVVCLQSCQNGSTEFGNLIIAPAHYHNLLRRFVWRHEVVRRIIPFIEQEDYTGPEFTRDMKRAMARNFWYANEVISYCAPGFREAARAVPQGMVRLFDIFMLEECNVGRHEPAAVILWQKDHPGHNLYCSDVLNADWKHRCIMGPAWEGRSSRWNPMAIDDMKLKHLLDQAYWLYEDWYDHPYAQWVNGERFYSGDVLADIIIQSGDNDDTKEDNSDSDPELARGRVMGGRGSTGLDMGRVKEKEKQPQRKSKPTPKSQAHPEVLAPRQNPKLQGKRKKRDEDEDEVIAAGTRPPLLNRTKKYT